MTCRKEVDERREGTGIGNNRIKKEGSADPHELLLQDLVTNVDMELIEPIDNLQVVCPDLLIVVEFEAHHVQHSNSHIAIQVNPLR